MRRMREFIRSFFVGLVGGLLILAYSLWIGTRDPLTLTVRTLVALVLVWILAEIIQTQWAISRLPRLAVERGDGLALRMRAPEVQGKRKLRQQTLALVREIRDYQKTQPAPYVETLRAHWEATALMKKAGSKEERTAIWHEFQLGESERYARESQSLAERFGGQLAYLASEYKRRGLLDDIGANRIGWQSSSGGWLASAAAELEALAMRL